MPSFAKIYLPGTFPQANDAIGICYNSKPKTMKKIIEKILPYSVVFLASLFRPFDPDLGWHLKYGEYFFRNGQILKDNIFSTMMPDYKWVNHSWATDLLTYVVFNKFDFFGLTILAAIVITLTFYFFSKASSLDSWEELILAPFVIFFTSPINQVSFRSQLLSIMFLGILFFILKRYENKILQKILLISGLFLVWANFHGQFILGIIVLIIWETIEDFRDWFYSEVRNTKKTLNRIRISLILVSSAMLASLVNPFGIGVYIEALNHFGNPSQKYILEWTSIEQLSDLWWNNIILAILIFLGIGILVLNTKHKDKIPFIALTLVFFILSFWERRYSWSLYYISLPILSPIAQFIKPKSKKATIYSSFVFFSICISVILIIKYPVSQFKDMSWDIYCKEYSKCSIKSIEYIKKNNLNKNLLTLYNWGGWMIWNYPQIKPSVDGRMSFWKDEKGYSAFEDYYGYEQNFKDINDSSYNAVLMSPGKPIYKRLLELVKEGNWKLVYSDDYSGVFVRNKI